MILNNFELLTDGVGLIYLPDNSSLLREFRNLVTNNSAEGKEILLLFEQFQDAGWIESYKKFNPEGDGFYAFKTKNIRVYGLFVKGSKNNYFVISSVFIKQNKKKEHNHAIQKSIKRLKYYEANLQRIYDNQG